MPGLLDLFDRLYIFTVVVKNIEAYAMLKAKQDEYFYNRGGESVFLRIMCSSCKSQIAIYQKHGPGELKRLYLDRIHGPPELVDTYSSVTCIKNVVSLNCLVCEMKIANPIIYEKENRLALSVFPGSIVLEVT